MLFAIALWSGEDGAKKSCVLPCATSVVFTHEINGLRCESCRCLLVPRETRSSLLPAEDIAPQTKLRNPFLNPASATASAANQRSDFSLVTRACHQLANAFGGHGPKGNKQGYREGDQLNKKTKCGGEKHPSAHQSPHVVAGWVTRPRGGGGARVAHVLQLVAKCIHDGKHGARQKGKENKNDGAARAQQQIAAESKRVNYSPTAVVQVVQAFERRAQAMRCDKRWAEEALSKWRTAITDNTVWFF